MSSNKTKKYDFNDAIDKFSESAKTWNSLGLIIKNSDNRESIKKIIMNLEKIKYIEKEVMNSMKKVIAE